LLSYLCVVIAYSWELTCCKRDFNGSKIYSNAYFIPPTALWELSLPPLRYASSSSFVLVPYGPTPLVFPQHSSSYEVSGFEAGTKGSY